MKLNVTVEMDWLAYDEEGDSGVEPDQLVKDAIIKGVMEKISGKLLDEVRSQATEQVKVRVNETITNMLENFLDQPVVITDRYGDVKERHESVKEMMKDQFDKFMEAPVDDSGNPTRGCGYNEKSRLNWLLTTHVNAKAAQFMKDVVALVDDKLKKQLDAELKARVSDALVKKLDIGSVVGK